MKNLFHSKWSFCLGWFRPKIIKILREFISEILYQLQSNLRHNGLTSYTSVRKSKRDFLNSFQKKNSFFTAYSLSNETLRAPATLTCRSPIIIGVLQFNSLHLIDQFILTTCSKVCGALLSEWALRISLNIATDFS